MAFDQGDASFRCGGSVVFVDHGSRFGFVIGQICAQFLKPWLAFVEGGERGGHGESVRLGHFIGIERAPYFMLQHGIRDHYGSRVKTGDIERFGRCHAGHGVHCALLIHRGKGYVIVSRIGQIAVNFVADYGHMIVPAKLTYACEGVAIPDSAYGIVRIAQNHQRGLRISQLGFQIGPVDGVMSGTVIFQWRFKHSASIIDNRIEENVVDRSLDKHILVGSGEFSYHAGDCRHHAGAKYQRFRVDIKIVPTAPPVNICLIPFRRNNRISENTVVKTLLQCGSDLWSGLKFHIRHPHGQRVPRLFPLERICSGAVYGSVEIVSHAIKLKDFKWTKSNASCE